MHLPYPFANRLIPPLMPGERQRIEFGMAGARVLLAVASLIAIIVDPTDPQQLASVSYVLMTLYLLISIGIFFYLRPLHAVSDRACVVIQTVDVAIPIVVSVFSGGPNSPFFVVFFFAVVEAAFRWGFHASFVNTLIGLFVQLVEVALLAWGPARFAMMAGNFEPNRLVIRFAYLLITGLVVGYAAEQEKQLRAEGALIARMAQRARSTEGSLNAAGHEVFGEMLRVFHAQKLMVSVHEIATDRIFCWWIEPEGETTSFKLSEVDYEQRDLYRYAVAAETWLAERSSGPEGATWNVTGIDADSRYVRQPVAFSPPPGAPLVEGAHSIMGVSFMLGTTFAGRVILRNPRMIAGVRTELRFAQKMLQQVAPALYNLYLVRRLRSRAGAIERARAARELHDGAIQSLIAAEMQVDVLRRRAAAGRVPESDLERIQQILRREILGLRELMQEMRPLDVGPHDLLDYLSSMVDKFRRDTGISAKFVTGLEEVTLSPRLCREVARIAQEALVNVRRHSGARSVLVRLHSENGNWELEIEDDGQGFGFAGRMTGSQMDASHKGPQVIRERVRQIGGELTIESAPGRGATLRIDLPQPKARVSYA